MNLAMDSARPVVVFGKWRGKPEGTITLSGLSGGNRKYEKKIDVSGVTPLAENSGLRYLWARARLSDLSDYGALDRSDKRVEQITELGLTYNLLTAHTSFVAIDTEVRRREGDATTVTQPLPLPEGVSDYAVGGAENYAASPPSTGAWSSMRSAPSPLMKMDARVGSGGSRPQTYAYRETARMGAEENATMAAGGPSGPKGIKQDEPSTADIPCRIAVQKVKVEGGLTEAAVKQIVEQNLDRIRNCLEKSGKNLASGTLTVKWSINGDGTAAKVLVTGGVTGEALNCLKGEVATWKFPAPKNGGTVHVTVTLSVSK